MTYFQIKRTDRRLTTSLQKAVLEKGQQMILNDVDNAEARTVLTTLQGIGSHLEKEMEKVNVPVVVMDGVNGDLVPIAKSKEIASRFHEGTQIEEKYKDNPLGQKIADRKLMYFQIGGVMGEHGHSVVNTSPEEMAVFINHAVNYFVQKAA